MRMHNTYSVLYNKVVFEVLKERFGEGEAVVFARSGTVGGQRFPVVRIFAFSTVYQRQITYATCSTGAATASRPSKPWLRLFAAR